MTSSKDTAGLLGPTLIALTHSRNGILQRLDSNGLLLGVLLDAGYPVCEFAIESGDRFVLYTDDVVEPENAQGQSFGESRLDEVMYANLVRPPGWWAASLLSFANGNLAPLASTTTSLSSSSTCSDSGVLDDLDSSDLAGQRQHPLSNSAL